MRFVPASCVLAATLLVSAHVQAQQPAPPPAYGPAISLETAKKVMAAAEAEAVKNNWGMVITILDSGGNLVMAHRMDNAPLASVGISRGKARTAVEFKRAVEGARRRHRRRRRRLALAEPARRVC
jgi:uncharacterized protein GlcG (DUF336 family)